MPWKRISLTSVDLPEPETPVTQVKAPSGKLTSMSRRLCLRAPRTVNHSTRQTALAGHGDGARGRRGSRR